MNKCIRVTILQPNFFYQKYLIHFPKITRLFLITVFTLNYLKRLWFGLYIWLPDNMIPNKLKCHFPGGTWNISSSNKMSPHHQTLCYNTPTKWSKMDGEGSASKCSCDPLEAYWTENVQGMFPPSTNSNLNLQSSNFMQW